MTNLEQAKKLAVQIACRQADWPRLVKLAREVRAREMELWQKSTYDPSYEAGVAWRAWRNIAPLVLSWEHTLKEHKAKTKKLIAQAKALGFTLEELKELREKELKELEVA